MRAAEQTDSHRTADRETVEEFARDVRDGLSAPNQKQLPCKYLYDRVGSALFEAICVLPEYGLTRADERILRRHANEIAAAVPPPVVVAELGSGSGKKARSILKALARRQPTTYHPIEISRAALAMSCRELGHLEGVSVLGFEAEYLEGLARAAARRAPDARMLVLFLGSSIGNFDRPGAGDEFLGRIRGTLRPGDAMLLGTDLVKPIPEMLFAYDDPAGVTAAFNLNLLARVNRELDGDFDLRLFRHEVFYDEDERRIEMHLRSLREQRVRIEKAGLEVHFRRGETIWTESSHKYTLQDVARMAAAGGFHTALQWIDEEWPFAQSLLVAS